MKANAEVRSHQGSQKKKDVWNYIKFLAQIQERYITLYFCLISP